MSNEAPGYQLIRRVVTGHDAGKVAKVLMDGPADNVKFPGPGTASCTVWCTDETPADIAVGESIEDFGARDLTIPPPAGGSRFGIVDFPPGNARFMHRTETIDYVIVMSGEIDMDMDASTVKLKTGDVMVQRGTHHAWVNRGTVPARVAFVLIDAKPLGIGKPVPGPAPRR
jgi:mannose-6-phosphate isomerase-like protein (cupin superfamily)